MGNDVIEFRAWGRVNKWEINLLTIRTKGGEFLFWANQKVFKKYLKKS
jgi:hypothetical protein